MGRLLQLIQPHITKQDCTLTGRTYSDIKDPGLLWCDAAPLWKQSQTLQMNIVPSFSRVKWTKKNCVNSSWSTWCSITYQKNEILNVASVQSSDSQYDKPTAKVTNHNMYRCLRSHTEVKNSHWSQENTDIACFTPVLIKGLRCYRYETYRSSGFRLPFTPCKVNQIQLANTNHFLSSNTTHFNCNHKDSMRTWAVFIHVGSTANTEMQHY